MTQMQKGECIDLFFTKLQEIQDSLETMGSTPQPTEMVRLALNSVQKSGKYLSRAFGAGRNCQTGKV